MESLDAHMRAAAAALARVVKLMLVKSAHTTQKHSQRSHSLHQGERNAKKLTYRSKWTPEPVEMYFCCASSARYIQNGSTQLKHPLDSGRPMFAYPPTGYYNMEHWTLGPDGSPMTADSMFYAFRGT